MAGKLNKELYTDINRLRLLNKSTSQPKFILDKSPFNEDGDEDETPAAAAANAPIVIEGRILPDSDIYNQGAYRIEMTLTSTFPYDPPDVKFITPIYHPNVDKDGKFCHELLKKTAKWDSKKSLVDVVKAVIEHVDKPNIDYSLSLELGREYMENRPEFNRKALEFVKKHALSRN